MKRHGDNAGQGPSIIQSGRRQNCLAVGDGAADAAADAGCQVKEGERSLPGRSRRAAGQPESDNATPGYM